MAENKLIRQSKKLTRRDFLKSASVATLLGSGVLLGTRPKLSWAQESSKYGGSVTIALPAECKTLDPVVYPDIYSGAVITQISEPLIWLDTSLKPTSQKLVEGWENPDPQTYIFHLKRGIKFHDGSELTAADAKFTFDSVMNPELASPRAHYYKDVEVVEAVDDYTLKIKLSAPYAPFIVQAMTQQIVPKHYVEKVGWEEFSRNPIGTGPYKFVEWKSGEHIKLERNEEYWGDLAFIETAIFRFIPEPAAGVMAMKGLDIDFLYEVPSADYDDLKNTPGVTTNSYKGLNYRYLGLNCTMEPFNQVKVRQAINYGIDTSQTVNLWAPFAVQATGPIPPYNWAYSADVPMYPRDVEKAKRLLAEAGYPNGFETTLTTSTGTRNKEEALLYQAQLAEIGIKVKIEQLEWGLYLDKLLPGKGQPAKTEMNRIGWTGMVDPYGYMEFLMSESDWNYVGYSNPKYDEILKESVRVVDRAKRKELYAQAQKIIKEDVPYVFLFHQRRARAYNEDLKGLTQWVEANGFGPLAQLSEWYWGKEK